MKSMSLAVASLLAGGCCFQRCQVLPQAAVDRKLAGVNESSSATPFLADGTAWKRRRFEAGH